MPIIAEYMAVGYTEFGETIINCTESIPCQKCGKGILKPRGHVHRHIRKEDSGEKEWFLIPVGCCNNKSCARFQRLLPSFMVPYKHYEEEAIADVLDEVITEESPVDFPSIQTMRRWIAWLAFNADRIEGLLRNGGYRILGFGEDLLFDSSSILNRIREDSDQWLLKIIRFVYNSGHRLLPF